MLSYCLLCVGNAMGRRGFSCKEMPSDCNICLAGDLSQRLLTLLSGLNAHLFHMKIYGFMLTAPQGAFYTEPEMFFLLYFVKYSPHRKMRGMPIVSSPISSVDIVCRLQTGQPRNRGLVLGRSNTFFSSQLPDRHWESTQPPIQRVTGALTPG
jgi:hypothetical protein